VFFGGGGGAGGRGRGRLGGVWGFGGGGLCGGGRAEGALGTQSAVVKSDDPLEASPEADMAYNVSCILFSHLLCEFDLREIPVSVQEPRFLFSRSNFAHRALSPFKISLSTQRNLTLLDL